MTFKNIIDVKVDFKWVAILIFTAGSLFYSFNRSVATIEKHQDKLDTHETRIVVLETQYQDIKEIKKDVKELLKRK